MEKEPKIFEQKPKESEKSIESIETKQMKEKIEKILQNNLEGDFGIQQLAGELANERAQRTNETVLLEHSKISYDGASATKAAWEILGGKDKLYYISYTTPGKGVNWFRGVMTYDDIKNNEYLTKEQKWLILEERSFSKE